MVSARTSTATACWQPLVPCCCRMTRLCSTALALVCQGHGMPARTAAVHYLCVGSPTCTPSCKPQCVVCAAVGLYCFLGLLMDGPATLASALIGLRIAPHFDQPCGFSSPLPIQ